MNETVVLRSEYQREFVGDKDGTFKENYEDMVKIRTLRKSYERSHTPIVWFEENHDKESLKTKKVSAVLDKDRPSTAPTLVGEIKDAVTCGESAKTVHPSTPDHNEGKGNSRSQSVQTNFEPQKIDAAVQSPVRHRPWCRQKRRKPLKPKKPVLIQDRPIISYGWADNTSIQKKRTYNVKAPISDVRPTALQAARRRESNLRNLMNKKERLCQEKLKTQAMIDSLTKFDQWQTEYRNEFCKK